jgi:hypothetical protein
MVLRLATVLDIPLREHNVLLTAAGYAPMVPARELTHPELQPVQQALAALLHQQEPYPAMVVDRHWQVLMGNAASTRVIAWLVDLQGAQAHLLRDGCLNLLRLLLHPDGIRPYVRNWHEVAGWLIERLHRETLRQDSSDATRALLEELLAYPEIPRAWHAPNWEVWSAPLLMVEFVKAELALRFFSTITTLGTPHDITLQELHVESFFPADDATAQSMQRLARASTTQG